MTQTQKLLIAVAVLAGAGFAANRFASAGVNGTGEACRRYVGEARSTCIEVMMP